MNDLDTNTPQVVKASGNSKRSAARDALIDLKARIGKSVLGQDHMVESMLIGLLANGNLLIESLPGLAKTRAVKTLAKYLAADLSRVQFTPDLLPSDVTGAEIYVQTDKGGQFQFQKGPIFANLVLADEINRAPAKVQSALLEAMQERQVTIGEETHRLPEPFLVMATQNPIEQEGTYALPEAQLDRFMLMVKVGYPQKQEEREIMDRMTSGAPSATRVEPTATLDELLNARSVVNQVYIDDKIRDYIINVTHATREPAAYGLRELSMFVQYGASPRASIFLNLAARAHAFLKRRGYVTPEDIKSVGLDVLRHRVILTYEAEAENVTSEDIVRRLFEHVEVP
jgi:MoxR-like ATPase